MLNGGLQILQSCLVPGNRHADTVDSALGKFDYIAFPNRSVQTAGVKAFWGSRLPLDREARRLLLYMPSMCARRWRTRCFNSMEGRWRSDSEIP